MADEVDYRLPIHLGLPIAFTEMGNHDQFMLWLPVWNAEKVKYDKIPISPDTGHTANPLDPANQRSYAEIQIAAQRRKAQIGFVFTESDPFFFGDIDDALLADNKTWSPVANQIATLFAGCAFEISYNGRGFHVFGQYTQAINHRNRRMDLKIELYIKDRWVALTGIGAVGACLIAQHSYASYSSWFGEKGVSESDGKSLADWQDIAFPEYKEIGTDAEVVIKLVNERPSIQNAFNGKHTVRQLYNAEDIALESYPSRSEAVYALLGKLYFYTGGNRVRMLRIFLASPLGESEIAREDCVRISDHREHPFRFNVNSHFARS